MRTETGVAAARCPIQHNCPGAELWFCTALFDAFSASPIKRDIKIGRGTHLMHPETMRHALYRESIAFLEGDDEAPDDAHRGP
jgi:hypothetical protein